MTLGYGVAAGGLRLGADDGLLGSSQTRVVRMNRVHGQVDDALNEIVLLGSHLAHLNLSNFNGFNSFEVVL